MEGYKINIQNSIAFLYTHDKYTEEEIRRGIQVVIAVRVYSSGLRDSWAESVLKASALRTSFHGTRKHQESFQREKATNSPM